MKVKICGITRYDDAVMAIEFGADMIGLNFYKPSPRYVEPAQAIELCNRLRSELGERCPVMIGVFANAPVSDISTIVEDVRLDFAQLSGDESDAMLRELRGRGFKAIRPPNKALAIDDAQYYSKEFSSDERAPSLILDAYHPKLFGGTGEEASVEVALAVKDLVPRMMLAGGLKPENVGERVAAIRPWGVDVASGVEPDGQPGIKDPNKTRQFIEAAKSV